MAMVLAETLPPQQLQKIEIWASDLSLEMLKVAAGAIYTSRDVQGISPQRLRRFFLLGRGPREGSFRIVPEIRDMVKFRHIDLRTPNWPVPTDLPMIFCRNVSIYFAEDERMDLLDRLAASLRPGGWLAIGNGEILPGVPNSLRKVAPSIYRKEATP
jgi:chemotaxis protein methyltransferase CheR